MRGTPFLPWPLATLCGRGHHSSCPWAGRSLPWLWTAWLLGTAGSALRFLYGFGGPLRGGRAFVAQKPAQCAVLLPCRPGLRGVGLPQEFKRPGEGPKYPSNSRGLCPTINSQQVGPKNPKRRRPTRSPSDLASQAFFPMFRCAMEVCCFSNGS